MKERNSAQNSLALRISLLVLLAGIIGGAGILLLTLNVKDISSNYQTIIVTAYRNKEYMDEIRSLLYREEALVYNHIRSDDPAQMKTYEAEEKQLAQQIRGMMRDFENDISGEERERLFHNLYSNGLAYLSAAENVFTLSREMDKRTADYYVSSVMADNINNVNTSINELKYLVDEELLTAKAELDHSFENTRTTAFICTIALVFVVLLVLFLCVGMTSNLEKYKRQLETELEQKRAELTEHNRRIMSIQNNTVIGMANLIESRDGDTGTHIKRTRAYVSLIANAAYNEGHYRETLTPEYIELLVKAAPMHDIGKIVIPDYILQKPGKLTDEEFEVMKQHTLFGFQILLEKKAFSDGILKGVLQHHEKINGRGYPQRIDGRHIHKYAKIISVADVFDALVTDRPYKSAFSKRDAVEMVMAMTPEMDLDAMKSFLDSLILYPVDSIVHLSNGELAKVVENVPTYVLRPKVVGLKTGKVYDLSSDLAYANIVIES